MFDYIQSLRTAIDRHARYVRTRREIEALPAEFAVEDLGIYPGDADRIAREAVYGRAA